MRKESIEKVSDFLRGKSGAATSSEIAEGTSLTEWTLRETLSSLEKEGKISINKKSRPYLYKWVGAKPVKINRAKKLNIEDSVKMLSTCRIYDFLNSHPNEMFDNKTIAMNLGLSSGTVSGNTRSLESLEGIVVPAVKKSNSNPVLLYQSKGKAKTHVLIKRDKEDVAVQIKTLLDSSKNKSFSKDDIVKRIGCSEGSINHALHVLVYINCVKLTYTSGKYRYQSQLGESAGIDLQYKRVPDYVTISEYVKENGMSSRDESILRSWSKGKQPTYVYTCRGLIATFSVDNLDKVKKDKCGKKSFIEKMKEKGMSLVDMTTGRWLS